MEVTKPISGVDTALGFFCIRWATGHEIDWTLDIELYAGQYQISAREYYVIVHLTS